MKPKNDIQIAVRMPTGLHDALRELADAYHTEPAGIVRMLVATFAEAFEKHGTRLAFPPQYAYHETEAMSPRPPAVAAAAAGVGRTAGAHRRA